MLDVIGCGGVFVCRGEARSAQRSSGICEGAAAHGWSDRHIAIGASVDSVSEFAARGDLRKKGV